MIPLSNYLVLGAILFSIGVMGIFLNRKNVITILMAIELILLAVNINFIAFSQHLGNLAGQVFVFFILTVAAAEAAVGLAILVLFFRNKRSIDVDDINSLNGCMPIPSGPEGLQYIYHEEGHAHEEPTLRSVREDLLEFYDDTNLVTDERVQRFFEMAKRNHEFAEKRAQAVTSTIEDANENLSYRGAHISEHASDLDVPVLLTWSRENRGATPEDAMGLFNRIDDAEMHIFTGAKHHVQTEYPRKWTDVVCQFLESDR
mgnify:CR=1 FL=1